MCRFAIAAGLELFPTSSRQSPTTRWTNRRLDGPSPRRPKSPIASEFPKHQFTSGMPRIMRGLHSQPHHRLVTEHLAEPNGHARADGAILAENLREVLPRHTQPLGDLRLGPAKRWKNVFAKEQAWMSWASIFIAFTSERGHLQLQCKTRIATSGFRFVSLASLRMRFSRVPAAWIVFC